MPNPRTTPKGYDRARKLRKNMTGAEKKLWGYLRARKFHGIKFRRQHALGNFVVDFCAIKEKLVIELDGSQHLDQHDYDLDRTRYLNEQGYHVLRFWNNQVINDLNGVMIEIESALHLK